MADQATRDQAPPHKDQDQKPEGESVDTGKKQPEPRAQPAARATTQSQDPIQAIADALQQAATRVQPAPPKPALHKTEGLDRTVRGGKFMVGGRLVNANNREIDQEGKILHPEELEQDVFGRTF